MAREWRTVLSGGEGEFLMTDKTMTIQRAAELLREEAQLILETHAVGDDWTGEPEAKAKSGLAARGDGGMVTTGLSLRMKKKLQKSLIGYQANHRIPIASCGATTGPPTPEFRASTRIPGKLLGVRCEQIQSGPMVRDSRCIGDTDSRCLCVSYALDSARQAAKTARN